MMESLVYLPSGARGQFPALSVPAANLNVHSYRLVEDEDDESISLNETIHQLAEQNREPWDMRDVSRKNRAKPTHHTHISVVHETMVAEDEEDQDEGAKGLICFEALYYTAVVTVREGEAVVAVAIDKQKAKPIT